MEKIFHWIRRVEEWLLAAGILIIAAMTVANVVARNVWGHSLAFTEEVSEFMIVQVCFVGLSYAAGMGRHIRMTALYDQLGDRLRKVLMIAIALTTGLMMFVCAWYAGDYVLKLRESGAVTPTLHVPLYLAYLIAPVGLALAGMQYALAVVRNLRSHGIYLSYDRKDEYDETPPKGL